MRGFNQSAGFAMREHDLAAVIIKGRLTLAEVQVLSYIERASTGWQYQGVNLSYGDIAKATELSRSTTIRAVKALVAMNILSKAPRSAAGPSTSSGFAVNYDKADWRLEPTEPFPKPNHDGFVRLDSVTGATISTEDSSVTDTRDVVTGATRDVVTGATISEPQTVVALETRPPLKIDQKQEKYTSLPCNEKDEEDSSFLAAVRRGEKLTALSKEALERLAPDFLRRNFKKKRLTEESQTDLDAFFADAGDDLSPWEYFCCLKNAATLDVPGSEEAQKFGEIPHTIFMARKRVLAHRDYQRQLRADAARQKDQEREQQAREAQVDQMRLERGLPPVKRPIVEGHGSQELEPTQQPPIAEEPDPLQEAS